MRKLLLTPPAIHCELRRISSTERSKRNGAEASAVAVAVLAAWLWMVNASSSAWYRSTKPEAPFHVNERLFRRAEKS